VLKKTPFEQYHQVFEGAWGRIEAAIRKAESYGIGVFIGTYESVVRVQLMIDLHSAAGGQNKADHSGTSSGKAGLFSSKSNLQSTSLALQFLASTLTKIPNVVGLELINEPDNNMEIQGWYERTISECRAVAGPDFPIYVSDCWDLQYYAGWTGGRDDWVVLDHHLYRCHAEHDQKKSADQHVQELKTSFGNEFGGHCGTAKGNVVVGEFSAALNPNSLPKGIPDGERDRYQREFVRAELEMFERHAAGWWFWTYKKGEGWDAGWSAQNATQAEILPNWVGSGKFKGQPPSHVKDNALQEAYGKLFKLSQ
jgi:glucan 1,3-beta-glucosidase